MPHKLGKYDIVEELGRGGMGVVYKGRDPDSGDDVAVKVLPAQLALDPVFRQRFVREVKTLERLEHPNVVKMLDHGHQEGALWYAMEYVEGTDLARELKREGRLPPLRAARIMLEAARALAYCHTRRVIHRDIKPANIMLAADGSVKLADFGIARVTDATRMTATAGVLGTVEYMSPEQAGGRMVDERTDVYSLGVVFYQAVAGRLPIVGKSPSDAIHKIQTAQISPPQSWVPEIPRNVNDLIMGMLEKDRTKRVLSAQALERELERVCGQMESPKPPEQLGESVVLADRRGGVEWARAWPFLVIAFALGVAVGAFWFGRSAEPPAAEAVMATVSRLLAEHQYHEADAVLKGLMRRSDLSDEQLRQAADLRAALDNASLLHDAAARLWIAAERARRAGKLELERTLLRLLVEDLPETRRAQDALNRLERLRAAPDDPGEPVEEDGEADQDW